MDREKKDMVDNGSYYYKLNQELSGQKSITPYFMEAGLVSQAVEMEEVREGELKGSAHEVQNLS